MGSGIRIQADSSVTAETTAHGPYQRAHLPEGSSDGSGARLHGALARPGLGNCIPWPMAQPVLQMWLVSFLRDTSMSAPCPALPLTRCVILGESLSHPGPPPPPHLQAGA